MYGIPESRCGTAFPQPRNSCGLKCSGLTPDPPDPASIACIAATLLHSYSFRFQALTFELDSRYTRVVHTLLVSCTGPRFARAAGPDQRTPSRDLATARRARRFPPHSDSAETRAARPVGRVAVVGSETANPIGIARPARRGGALY
jgi:hypothetical protein